jgi:hypothetical protein
MRLSRQFLATTIVAILLVGCTGDAASQQPTPTTAATDIGQPSSTAAASASPATSLEPSGEPSPTEALGPFSCDLPIHIDATVGRANITDVRVGGHGDYDRIVFEFSDGLPEASLERATPPFTHDASGAPIAVEGTSFLRLILRGGTKQTESGDSSYDGPLDFDPSLPAVVDLIEGGDFEAQSTWYIGLTGEKCVRLMTLVGEGGSPRLVIDVEH